MPIRSKPVPVRALKPRKRLTQAERRTTMRKRLLEATLEGLAADGYSQTSVTTIVRRAGVSRGAHVHHYPSKSALIQDAAKLHMQRTYRKIGEIMLAMADSDDRLQGLIQRAWSEVYSAPPQLAALELMIASYRDASLAQMMRSINVFVMDMIKDAADHYFEPTAEGRHGPGELMHLTMWLLNGMALEAAQGEDPAMFTRHLDIWADLLAREMRTRRGVRTPPPRPRDWDQWSLQNEGGGER